MLRTVPVTKAALNEFLLSEYESSPWWGGKSHRLLRTTPYTLWPRAQVCCRVEEALLDLFNNFPLSALGHESSSASGLGPCEVVHLQHAEEVQDQQSHGQNPSALRTAS